jgi:hypothetical protein
VTYVEIDARASPNYAVRKEGVEPSRELPNRNLNRDVDEVSGGKDADSLRQVTSENASERHLSGRSGPVLDLLERARACWVTDGKLSKLRRDLLEVLRSLEGDDEA